MKTTIALIVFCCCAVTSLNAQAPVDDGIFKIALPDHAGQLQWRAEGFKTIEASAKQNGHEIGVRATNQSGRLAFLSFLFLIPEEAPLTSEKCRDGILKEMKTSPNFKLTNTSRVTRDDLQIEVVSYSIRNRDSVSYGVRAFIATGDSCGDLEIYSNEAINPDDRDIRPIIESFWYDAKYAPQFKDVFMYAQILYNHHMYREAAPLYETALAKLNPTVGPDEKTMRRVLTDQAGMSYGISGNTKKARAIFEAGIQTDPDYPLYYYNLACADAEEKKLSDARRHLEQAFARKNNMLPGESIPDPTKDDSFLPYRENKEFWAFLTSLH